MLSDVLILIRIPPEARSWQWRRKQRFKEIERLAHSDLGTDGSGDGIRKENFQLLSAQRQPGASPKPTQLSSTTGHCRLPRYSRSISSLTHENIFITTDTTNALFVPVKRNHCTVVCVWGPRGGRMGHG